MAKILAVDDSESIRKMVELTLEDDHEVVLAEDGLVGLNKAKAEIFDLVITDINMPNMGGFELIKELRQLKEYQAKPIICVTTESSDEQKNKGTEAGATGWMTKPFSPEKLLNIVDRLV